MSNEIEINIFDLVKQKIEFYCAGCKKLLFSVLGKGLDIEVVKPKEDIELFCTACLTAKVNELK